MSICNIIYITWLLEASFKGQYEKINNEADPVGLELVFVGDDVKKAINKVVENGAKLLTPPIGDFD